MPVALNLDGVPGPDGVAVKLFANVGNATKPAAIRSGEIEIVLFDGLLDGNSNPLPKPAHIWTFTAKELKEFETQAMVGTGYQLTLRWGSFKPKSDRVSVIARHPIGEGRYLYSTPESSPALRDRSLVRGSCSPARGDFTSVSSITS